MPTAPYDTLEQAANTARMRLNDAIASASGEVFTDTAAFSLGAVNAAWRRFQQLLANYGVAVLNREVILTAVPATVATDQGVFVWFDFVNYFNGSTTVSAPVFPQDMISPLDLFERPNGTTGNYTPMDRVFDGLPTTAKEYINRRWEWREETIYMPGATAETDIRMRYAGYFDDFVASGTTIWADQPIPIMFAMSPFAWAICYEIGKARGDMDVASFDQAFREEVDQIWNREPRQFRSIFKGSEYGKMTDPRTPTDGPVGPRGPEPQKG